MSGALNRSSINSEKVTLRKAINKRLRTQDTEQKQNASTTISNKLIKLIKDDSF